MLFNDNLRLINRLSYIIIIIAISIFIFSYYKYYSAYFFYINNITINGNFKNIAVEQISNVAKYNIHGNLTDINIYDLQKTFHNLPWVKDVVISKVFPHTINIYINEYKPYAKINNNAYITIDGHKFISKFNNEGIPLFFGNNEDIVSLITINIIINNLLSVYKVKVKQLTYNDIGLIKFTLSNNVMVETCEIPITDKIKLLSKYWNKLFAINKNLTHINLCYKSAIAIDKETVDSKITKKLIKNGE